MNCQWRLRRFWLRINHQRFDDDGRRLRIERNRRRINNRDALLRRKPDASVTSADSGGLRAAIAFRVEHSVNFAVRNGRDFLRASFGEIIQLRFSDAINSQITTDPKVTRIIRNDLKRAVIE